MTDKDQSPITLADEFGKWFDTFCNTQGSGDTERCIRDHLKTEEFVHFVFNERNWPAINAAIRGYERSPDPTAAYQRGREDMRREAANTAAMFSINQTPLHPDIPWEKMSREAKAVEHTTCQEVAHAILALPPAKAAETETERTWRCFHCDEIFTTVEAAREHFGADEIAKTGCQIDVAEYRRLEQQQDQCRAECCEEAKRYGAAEDDRRRALVREEQKGYDKGVRDARAEAKAAETGPPEPVPSVIAESVKPAPGQGELRYYTLGPNADRVCTRCEFNLSADARDHQWVHDQKRDEAVREEREACAKIAELSADDRWIGMRFSCQVVAKAIRAHATAVAPQRGGASAS